MDDGILFAVVHAELFYRSPARYGETLTIATTLKEMRAASFTFAHEIREKASGRLVVEGSARLVAVDTQGKLVKLPRALRAVRERRAVGDAEHRHLARHRRRRGRLCHPALSPVQGTGGQEKEGIKE